MTIAPLHLLARSAEPTSPSEGDIYLDSGVNTTSTDPGWRYYNGAAWEDLGGSGGADADAIHNNVAAEISAIAQKVTPVSADVLLIEDSEDSFNKKYIEIGDLPASGGDTLPVVDTTALVKGSVDDTKQFRIEVDGFTAGQTRVATPPDEDFAMVGVATAQTLANKIMSQLHLIIGGFKAIFTHAFSADRTVTLPGDADVTLVGVATAQTLTNKTLTTPTIADFTNATHDHSDAASGGAIDAAVITYTPAVNTDWDSDADPGDVGNALDQLAERVDDLEGAGGGGNPFAILADEKAAGTAGGSAGAATWNARDLNTERSDIGNIVTIASNQFTPIAGTYRIHASAPLHQTGAGRLRLYNVTGAASVTEGQNAYIGASDDGAMAATLDDEFTANGTDAYRIDHYSASAQATNGLGILLNVGGAVETYLVIYLEKIA